MRRVVLALAASAPCEGLRVPTFHTTTAYARGTLNHFVSPLPIVTVACGGSRMPWGQRRALPM
jgi:hypothetical protein